VKARVQVDISPGTNLFINTALDNMTSSPFHSRGTGKNLKISTEYPAGTEPQSENSLFRNKFSLYVMKESER
jgi:hypothetical protein